MRKSRARFPQGHGTAGLRQICYCVIVTGLVAGGVGTKSTSATEPSNRSSAGDDAVRYNLLIIQTDEHNFRTLGCYRELMRRDQALMWGPAVVETPNIDWIAKQGAICTSFYATTPVCSPSRAAFVTGRYPQNTPVVTNNVPLSDNVITFASLLQSQGYQTGFAGKWHLDGDGKPQWAPRRKFGFSDNRFMFNRGHWKRLEMGTDGPRVASRSAKGVPNYSVAGATSKDFTTDFLVDRTLEFIEQHQKQPFCYWLSLPDPHGPDTVRPPYDTMFAKQEYRPPRTFTRTPEQTPAWGTAQRGGYNQAAYYGMVKCIDDNVGRLIARLRKLKLLERTIVVFTSDHGDLRGEHHRQNKGVPYEASAKIPFLIYCPGKIQPGTIVHQALGCVDFQPTILRLLNVAPSGQEEGRDASCLLMADQTVEPWHDIAFLRGTGTNFGWMCAVTDRYKLVLSPVDRPWLFDLQRDPDEVTNFFDHPAYREQLQEMARGLADYGRRYKEPFMRLPRIKADLAWAMDPQGDYREPPAVRNRKTGKQKTGKKSATNKKSAQGKKKRKRS